MKNSRPSQHKATVEQSAAAMRRVNHDATVAALREGRRPPRAATFKSAADYRRRPKHRKDSYAA